jgi:hypothetical protein
MKIQALLTRGQSNSPNISHKIRLKQLQCCRLSGLKYIYSELLTLDVQNKTSRLGLILNKSDNILAADFSAAENFMRLRLLKCRPFENTEW